MVFAYLLTLGCGGASTTGGSAAAPAAASTPPPLSVASCGGEIAGTGALLAPGAVLLLGEVHGTVEAPAFAGNVACRAAFAGVPVHLGLEIPRTEQPAIDRYLAGAGTEAERDALLAGEHWQRDDQDGRGSVAMLALIERMRQLHEHGLDIQVFAFDVATQRAWNERDAGMAERILAQATAHPEALVLTLSGNLHTLTTPGLPWDDSLVPMGVHVKAGHERVTSLDIGYARGSAWICQPNEGCGAVELLGNPAYRALRIDTGEAARKPGHDGVFVVGSVTAAPPAAQQ